MVKITIDLLHAQIQDLITSPLYHCLLWLIVFDIIAGYVKAFKTKSFDSKISTNGWLKHGLVLMLMTVIGVYARALDYVFVSYFICLGFIGSYGLSLLENLDIIGVPYPEKFRSFFKQMKDNDIVKIKNDGKIKIDVSDDENITINKD